MKKLLMLLLFVCGISHGQITVRVSDQVLNIPNNSGGTFRAALVDYDDVDVFYCIGDEFVDFNEFTVAPDYIYGLYYPKITHINGTPYTSVGNSIENILSSAYNQYTVTILPLWVDRAPGNIMYQPNGTNGHTMTVFPLEGHTENGLSITRCLF